MQAFGEENRELCYMVNSWIDSPVRTKGKSHRESRHDALTTPFQAIRHYGDMKHGSDPKNLLVARIVLHHLRLDGMITPYEEMHWMARVRWKQVSKNMEAKIRRVEHEKSFLLFDPDRFIYNTKREIRHCSICGKRITKDGCFDTLRDGKTVCQECLDDEKNFSLIKNRRRTSLDETNSSILASEMIKGQPRTVTQSGQPDAREEARLRLEELRSEDQKKGKRSAALTFFVFFLSYFVLGIYCVTSQNSIIVGAGIVAMFVSGFLLLLVIRAMFAHRV